MGRGRPCEPPSPWPPGTRGGVESWGSPVSQERKDEVRAMRNVALGSVLAVLLALPAAAQLKLPAPSPSAKVSQEVGLTEVTIEYSSPGVKGRKVWGALVPYEQPWRSGANAATKVTFSRDVTFGGKPVPAGTYALVTLPSAKGGWTVALSRELGLWTGKTYDPKDDVVRVSATTTQVPHRERLTYLFSNTTDDSTSLDLEWERLRVSVPVKVDTTAHAKANIQSSLGAAWRMHANAARYLSETQKDHDTALRYADTALSLDANWYTQWTKAEILARKGQFAEARKHAQAAWDAGQKDQNFFFRDAVSRALTEWKGK